MLMSRVMLGLWCTIGVCCSATAAHQLDGVAKSHRRAFQVNDLFRSQGLGKFVGGPYAYSEDGRSLAVTILRPINTDPSQRWNELESDTLQSNARGDVWVQEAAGEPLKDITHGTADGSGWFSPQWSPDGIHLAMLSTRGGKLRLWTWNRLTGRLSLLARGEVTFSLQQRNTLHDQPYVWLDALRIMFTALPEDTRREVSKEYEYMQSESPALAAAAWQRYLSGRRSTASALDDLSDPGLPPGGNLVVADLAGHENVVARNVDTLLWQPSPNGEFVAFTRATRIMPKPREYLQAILANGGEWRVEVMRSSGQRVIMTGAESRDVIPTSLRWSPRGATLAYLGYATQSQIAPSLYLANVSSGRVTAVKLTGVNAAPGGRFPNPVAGYGAPGLKWAATGQLIVRGARNNPVGREDSAGRPRQDWWLISPGGVSRCLTCRMLEVPQTLWPEDGRTRFFGLASDKLWQLDVSSRAISDLTAAQLRVPVDSIIAPMHLFGNLYRNSVRRLLHPTYMRAAFLSLDHGVTKPYVIDFRSHAITPLRPPVRGARVDSIDPHADSLLYLRNDRSGLFLWRQDARSSNPQLLFTANTYLRQVSKARLVHFAYTSLDGDKLNAWLLLPLGYRSGRRYPMITFVYPTYNLSAKAIPWQIEEYTELSSESIFNMQIAAAHGYAVLFPSVPVAYDDRKKVGVRVFNGVLPAVNAAVRRGFADPRRLAVWGVSYGGEAVCGLIARTRIFSAAISSSGVTDLISAYGTLDARYRYGEWAEEDSDLDFIIESGQLNLGGPPWKHWSRYIRNSPIFSVSRVHTPLLITAGDLDFVPIQQSEEFFRALVRQHEPVRFVRYWGEEHLLTSPANIREYWQEIFSWLTRYLPEVGDKGGQLRSSTNTRPS